MKSIQRQPRKRKYPPLPARTDIFKHLVHIGFQVVEYARHMGQTPFKCIHAGKQYFVTWRGRLFGGRHWAPIKDRVKVLRVPAKRHRKGFQGAPTAAALNGVALNFPDDRRRDMRALGKFALTPSKLSYALIDGFGDRRPILRHSIPPTLPPSRRG